MSMGLFALMTLVVGVTIAAYADVRTRRIPNLLTGALAAIALFVGASGGLPVIATTLLLMTAVFFAGTAAFKLGWFGGGDVKLLTACCGLAGPGGSVEVIIYTLFAGGILAVAESARQRRLREVLVGAFNSATRGIAPSSRTSVPYGLAIAAGSIAYVLSTFPQFHFLRLAL